MKKKIIVAGHICIDITPKFPPKKRRDVAELLRPGRLIQMGEADVHTGGVVANTGLAMKVLGADVSLMGKTGQDAFGDMIYNILKTYDAQKGLIRLEEEATSYTVVLAIPGIDRMFLHNPGPNNTFCAEDLDEEALKKGDLFHFGYPPLMRSMYINDGDELVNVFQKAKAAGCATSLDLADIDENSEAGDADWDLILKRILPLSDFFVPSAEELCYILDHEKFLSWQENTTGKDITEVFDIEKDIRPLAEKCLEYGAKVVLIKCGAAGIYYRTAAKEVLDKISIRIALDTKTWADKEGFEKSFVPENVLSGTGAGDTSIAAFLTAMCEGRTIEQCVELAAATGASCVEAYDSLSGLKSFEELERKIASGWAKNR